MFANCTLPVSVGARVRVQWGADEHIGIVIVAPDQMLEYHGDPPVAEVLGIASTGLGAAEPARSGTASGREALNALSLPPEILRAHRLLAPDE